MLTANRNKLWSRRLTFFCFKGSQAKKVWKHCFSRCKSNLNKCLMKSIAIETIIFQLSIYVHRLGTVYS